MTNKSFTFELYETGANFAVTGTPVTTTNGSDGSFSFPAKIYEAAGTYYYVLQERAGAADKGITYAQNKVQITVVVTDDGAGNLIPTVTTNDSAAVITTDAQNSRVVTVSGLTFTNKYAVKPATYLPEAQKRYDSADGQMETFEFDLTVNGGNKQTRENDANGKVLFEELTFDAVGTYEVKIREKIDVLWGLIRWDKNVYTITLHVEDDGEGQLFINEQKTTIVSDKGDDDILFRNAHHDVIVDKEVFRPAEPSVNIDGKAVEKGELLTYQISYKNFDSVAVDVEITDTVSRYTEFVAGSASHNGAYADGTVTWLVEDVAPGETVTVSFQVKVTGSQDQLVENQATLVEGDNTYTTKTVKNPVKEDQFEKDVFLASDASVSIDGKAVEMGDILKYELTYTNSDDFAAKVTITDTLSQLLTYVEGSADKGGTYADGTVKWVLELEAGESVTVSFAAKVIEKTGSVTNQAVALEDGNELKTNAVTNPVKEDEVTKDVAQASAPTVSVDGQTVKKGDTLLYTITYKNNDDLSAKVSITDTLSQYLTFVEGSADKGGTYAEGTVKWELELEAGEAVTVSFKATVNTDNVSVTNQAVALEGENTIKTDVVTTPVEKTPEPTPPTPPTPTDPSTPNVTPDTGDNSQIMLFVTMMAVSAAAVVFLLCGKKKETAEE